MSYSITPEQHKTILTKYSLPYDRLVRERERDKITSIARSTAWQLEKEGKYPARKTLGKNSCAWSLVELLHWIENPPIDCVANQPTKRRGG
ncbi:transcriptional regulator [Gilliamella sp. wkB178]|uniref:AlpA family phage regulatory protein n=1 Tax=Gilliamella sp. wkB178 TaxID=3120259 RepID=UPI00080DE587|nr:AlpA family phage regulatory protein [Gilliamella apicola]OCG08039.1 transcriptional regulator [Gilliamella apicola]